MKTFDAAATRDALPFTRLIPALERLFCTGCEVPPRHVHSLGAQSPNPLTVLIMPAWIPGQYLGIKTVNIAPANAERGLPGLHSTYLLFDAKTGVPLAQMDGNEITSRRTAAASALAASRLARADSHSLLVLGAGRVGSLVGEAYREVLPITRVTVWTRGAAIDLAEAAAEADIVSCATLATEPLIRGAWLRPGSHLDLIGSFTPAMREADDAAFAGASLYVDSGEALLKSGDLLGPMSRGVFSAADVKGTLADLCRNKALGRVSDTERTVFKSVGTALEDLAAAVLIYES
jgi:ornithine cyclodeaminase/alanine dehydrogenase-like protein (mu-crystallin family)